MKLKRALAICLAIVPCVVMNTTHGASSNENPFVIAGMSYSELSSIIETKEKIDFYIRKVSRNYQGTSLKVNYGGLGESTALRSAILDVSGMTIINSWHHEFDPNPGFSLKNDKREWILGSGARFPIETWPQVLVSQNGKYVLKIQSESSSIASYQSPMEDLVTLDFAFQAGRFYATDDAFVYVIGNLGDGGKNPFTILKCGVSSTNRSVRRIELPWASDCYDMHPETGVLLLAELKDWMPRSYEFDLKSESRKKVGYAQEYMFYLRKDFAKSLPLKTFGAIKRPNRFNKE